MAEETLKHSSKTIVEACSRKIKGDYAYGKNGNVVMARRVLEAEERGNTAPQRV